MAMAKISARIALVLAAGVTASLLATSVPAMAGRTDPADFARTPDAKQLQLRTGHPGQALESNRRARAGMLAVQPNVALTPCDDDPSWFCGSVRVPVDRAQPKGRKLSVAFAVFPHTNPDSTAKDAVFASDGGPGISNLANRGFLQFLTDGLTEDRDLFVVDYRGTAPPARSTAPGSNRSSATSTATRTTS